MHKTDLITYWLKSSDRDFSGHDSFTLKILLYQLLKSMVERRAPETAINYVHFLRREIPKVIKAYLFGSYAKGKEGPDSDMDIAVIFEDFPDSFDMQVDLMKLRRKYDTKIEPHPFRKVDFNLSNPIAYEILKTGLEIV